MRRRVLVVATIGALLTAVAIVLAWRADYTGFDPEASVPRLVAAIGLVVTLLIVAGVVAASLVERRVQAQADVMTARLHEREQDLIQTNRELERFATIAAHDLQEPLRAILTFTSLIERKYGPGMEGEALSHLLRVSAAAQRMRALIESLLVYARVGQEERQFSAVDLGACASAAIANIESLVIESGASFEVGELPTVRGNEEALIQLFTNLFSNAIKYRLGRPVVRVGAQRRDDEWVVDVADDGRGIDPANHQKIFELFRRVEPGDTVAGTGLGLSICARVVDLHGGRIWVRSNVGQGATFSFSLPATAERRRRRELT